MNVSLCSQVWAARDTGRSTASNAAFHAGADLPSCACRERSRLSDDSGICERLTRSGMQALMEDELPGRRCRRLRTTFSERRASFGRSVDPAFQCGVMTELQPVTREPGFPDGDWKANR